MISVSHHRSKCSHDAGPRALGAGRKVYAMRKITHMKNLMTARCAHPHLWNAKNCDDSGYPASELGFVRCDNDGAWWHHTVWPVHPDVATSELIDEFNAVLDAFRRSFRDLGAMRQWCHANGGRTDDRDEYNAYYDGRYGYFWFRMITRRGDYNLYLHCFSKAAMQPDDR